ncbi:MAG: hypothetical protein ACRYG7_33515 [Janthinobacterium lividum]
MVPAATFLVHAGIFEMAAGLSLRGHCDTLAAAKKLEQAANEVIGYGLPCVWVDCQRLLSLSGHGQRALYNAHQRAQQADTSIYWCGLTAEMQEHLSETGLHLLLRLLPASGYRGPAGLLQDTVPTVQHTRSFAA